MHYIMTSQTLLACVESCRRMQITMTAAAAIYSTLRRRRRRRGARLIEPIFWQRGKS